MRLCNFTNNDIFRSNFKVISLITAVSVTMLFSLVDQTGWAAVINCPPGVAECYGTADDDIITGSTNRATIHGLGGNDYITGVWSGINTILGEDGNDILIGGNINDTLFGGRGNDMYDGLDGNDIIFDHYHYDGSFVNNNDIISGGLGDDYIGAGEGSDRIEGGRGNDTIVPNVVWRDFSSDFVNCGSGTDRLYALYSGDNDTALNCESIFNPDQ